MLSCCQNLLSVFKFGTTVWVLLAGLVLINIGMVTGLADFNRWTLNRILFHLNPFYWRAEFIPVCWCLVLWLLNDWLTKKRLLRRIFRIVLLAAVAGCFYHVAVWRFLCYIGRMIYYDIYLVWFVGPVAGYMYGGQLSWKIFTIPAVLLVLILILGFYKWRKNDTGNRHTIRRR